MQTASAELAAAITSREREPVLRVKADWLRDGTYSHDPGVFRDTFSDTFEGVGDIGDLTRFVTSVTVDRSLSSDLPDAARIDTGHGAAEASAALAGDLLDNIPLERALTPHGGTAGTMRRVNAPVTVDMGAVGANGAEYLRQFTGKVRSVGLDPFGGAISLSALDGRERMRTPVALPVVVADDFGTVRPGLNAQWVMDYIARAQGIYASPPVRSSCYLSATLHGSAQPEVGTITTAETRTGTPSVSGAATFAPFADGLLGVARPSSAHSVKLDYAVAAGLNTNSGSTIFVEAARIRLNDTALAQVATLIYPGGAWAVFVDVSTAGVRVRVFRNTASADITVALSSLTLGEHYLGVQVTMTATGFDVQAKCDGVTGSGTGVVANSTGCPSITALQSGAATDVIISGLQVTSEAYVSTMFNDAFVPTATYQQSFNELTATPISDSSDPWNLEQQIATAEQGIILFDENDMLRFYNREHMTGGAAVATITASDAAVANLKALQSSETVDSVANYITVGAVPLALDAAGTVIWSVTEVLAVPASGSITVPVEFPGPVHTLASTAYKAAQSADGTGGDVANLTITTTRLSASFWTLTVTNPNAFVVYVVGNSTSGAAQGDPILTVTGRCVRPATQSGYKAVRSDASSIAYWGNQPLDVSENLWRQSRTAADLLADWLLAALKDPHPTLSGVEIVGDPRLQLGDRVRVVEPDGLSLDGDFWLVGINETISATGGLTQSVALRQA